MKKYLSSAGFIAVFFFSSCQSSRELHHFRAGNNYYRLKINEFAFLSSSRYISGYFDENAVDSYFGEITRPDTAKAHFVKTERILSDGSVADNAKLVLILSSNSNVITDQINALASNDQTLELMARLANKDAISECISIQNEITAEENRINSIINSGQQYIMALDSAAVSKGTKLKDSMLDFINYVAITSGYKIKFTNLNDAEIWYQTVFTK